MDNSDVLSVGSGSQGFIRTVAPAPLVASATYPGGIVHDIVFDLNDFMTGYVIDVVLSQAITLIGVDIRQE